MSVPQKGMSLFDSYGQQISFQPVGVAYHLPVLTAAEVLSGANTNYVIQVGGTVPNTGGTIKPINVSPNGALITVDEFAEGAAQTLTFSVNTGMTRHSVTTRRPILSIQTKAGAFTIQLLLRKLQLSGSGNQVLYEVVYNGTLTGSNFVSASPTSSVNFDTAATSISGGIVVDSGFMQAANSVDYQLHFGFTNSVPDILTVVATSMGTSAVPISAALRWTENPSL